MTFHRIALRNLELDQWGECALMRWSDAPSAVLLCGTFDFEHVHATSLFQYLPDVIHIPHSAERPLNRILELMADEAEAQRPAREVVLRCLSDILFVQVVQHWVQMHGKQDSGWLGAFHDPLIGKALALMHSQPQHPWKVASLAHTTACSRSTFAARFCSPLHRAGRRIADGIPDPLADADGFSLVDRGSLFAYR